MSMNPALKLSTKMQHSTRPQITPTWGYCYLKVTFGPSIWVAATSPTAERTGCVGDPQDSLAPQRTKSNLKTCVEAHIVRTSCTAETLSFSSEVS